MINGILLKAFGLQKSFFKKISVKNKFKNFKIGKRIEKIFKHDILDFDQHLHSFILRGWGGDLFK